MNSLHVHGRVTPTSRVTKSRPLKPPLSRSPIKKSRPIPSPSSPANHDSRIIAPAQIECDFRGLDVLSAIEYLSLLRTVVPAGLSRDRRTELLNRRRNMPDLVLSHQITSLFPDMRDLEKEIRFLVEAGRIIEIPMQDGEMAYIRTEKYRAPAGLLNGHLTQLSDDQVREFSQSGYLVRRNGELILSVPNIGSYFTSLKNARVWLCSNLRKLKGMALEKDMLARYEVWKDGGVFTWECLMHDLVGSNRIEILQLNVGKALRLTKRGRELR